MKYSIFDLFVAIIAISLALFFTTLVSKFFHKEELQPTTRYEVTLECQRLSANKTNDNWAYKDCVDELTKSLTPNIQSL